MVSVCGSLNAHAQFPNWATVIHFCLVFLQCLFYMPAKSKSSGAYAQTRPNFCWWASYVTLRKHDYSNILKILSPKNENFQMKNSDILHISALNIDCGYSLEPPR